MIKRVSIIIGFLVAAVLAIAGCGGDDSTASSLTKAQFIKQADAICKQADEEQLDEMARADKETPGGFSDPVHQIRVVVKGALPPIQKEAEEIAALGAPSGDEDEIAAIVAGIEEAVKKSEDDPVHAMKTAFRGVDKLAAEYGFKACSETL